MCDFIADSVIAQAGSGVILATHDIWPIFARCISQSNNDHLTQYQESLESDSFIISLYNNILEMHKKNKA